MPARALAAGGRSVCTLLIHIAIRRNISPFLLPSSMMLLVAGVLIMLVVAGVLRVHGRAGRGVRRGAMSDT